MSEEVVTETIKKIELNNDQNDEIDDLKKDEIIQNEKILNINPDNNNEIESEITEDIDDKNDKKEDILLKNEVIDIIDEEKKDDIIINDEKKEIIKLNNKKKKKIKKKQSHTRSVSDLFGGSTATSFPPPSKNKNVFSPKKSLNSASNLFSNTNNNPAANLFNTKPNMNQSNVPIPRPIMSQNGHNPKVPRPIMNQNGQQPISNVPRPFMNQKGQQPISNVPRPFMNQNGQQPISNVPRPFMNQNGQQPISNVPRSYMSQNNNQQQPNVPRSFMNPSNNQPQSNVPRPFMNPNNNQQQPNVPRPFMNPNNNQQQPNVPRPFMNPSNNQPQSNVPRPFMNQNNRPRPNVPRPFMNQNNQPQSNVPRPFMNPSINQPQSNVPRPFMNQNSQPQSNVPRPFMNQNNQPQSNVPRPFMNPNNQEQKINQQSTQALSFYQQKQSESKQNFKKPQYFTPQLKPNNNTEQQQQQQQPQQQQPNQQPKQNDIIKNQQSQPFMNPYQNKNQITSQQQPQQTQPLSYYQRNQNDLNEKKNIPQYFTPKPNNNTNKLNIINPKPPLSPNRNSNMKKTSPRYSQQQQQPYQMNNFQQNNNYNSFQQNNINNNNNFDISKHFPARPIATFGFGGRLVTMIPKPNIQVPLYPNSIPNNDNNNNINNENSGLKKGPIKIFKICDLISINNICEDIDIFPGPLNNNYTENDIINYLDKKINIEIQKNNNENIMITKLLKFYVEKKSIDTIDNSFLSELFYINNNQNLLNNQYINNLNNNENNNNNKDPNILNQKTQEIELLMCQGKRKEAIEICIDIELWGLAVIISSMCDKQTYQNVANRYTNSLFNEGTSLHSLPLLFSGYFNDSIISHQRNLQEQQQQIRQQNQQNYPSSIYSMANNWQKNICSILSNRVSGWENIAISLGDVLKETGTPNNILASHLIYLLTGLNLQPPGPGSRLVLIGADHFNPEHASLRTSYSIEALFRNEIIEWIKTQNNKQTILVPIQVYKLRYAMLLCDLGLTNLALEYINSIWNVLKISGVTKKKISNRNPFSPAFIYALKEFDDRLTNFNNNQNNKSYNSEKDNKSSLGWGSIFGSRKKDNDNNNNNNNSSSSSNTDLEYKKEKHRRASSNGSWFGSILNKMVNEKEDEDVKSDNENNNNDNNININNNSNNNNNNNNNINLQIPDNNIQTRNTIYSRTPPPLSHNELDGKPIRKSYSTPNFSDNKKDPKKDDGAEEDNTNKEKLGNKKQSWLKSWITKKIYPDAVEAHLGDEQEAYYDEKRKKWIFPGRTEEDADDDNSAPPIMTPMGMGMGMGNGNLPNGNNTMPPSSSNNMPPSISNNMPPNGNNINNNNNDDYDPLANLMAPPARTNLYSASNNLGPPSIPSSNKNNNDDDPLNNLMAPPSRRNLYSATSNISSSNNTTSTRPKYATFLPNAK